MPAIESMAHSVLAWWYHGVSDTKKSSHAIVLPLNRTTPLPSSSADPKTQKKGEFQPGVLSL
eukprot:3740977-Rhodomonas_salina.1